MKCAQRLLQKLLWAGELRKEISKDNPTVGGASWVGPELFKGAKMEAVIKAVMCVLILGSVVLCFPLSLGVLFLMWRQAAFG